MKEKLNRREVLKKLGTVVPAFGLGSCGTILYPERRGRVSGRIDPAVVVMDGMLCLLFILPGVIAFAVDFGSGAIYTGGHAGLEKHGVEGGHEEDYDAVLARVAGHGLRLGDARLRVDGRRGVLRPNALRTAKDGNGRRARLVKDSAGKVLRAELV